MTDEREQTLSWKETVSRWLKGKNKTTLLMIIGIVGVVLIGLSSLFGGGETTAATAAFDADAYTKALEERLETMVSSVKGAGKARVMVTLENGIEYVYADEETYNADRSEDGERISNREDTKRSVVTVDGGNGKEGLLVTQIEPMVRGVVVACEGANDDAVADRVSEAVQTALDITEKRVCVIPYETEGA